MIYYISISIFNIFPSLPKQTFYFTESLTGSQAKLNFQEIAIVTALAIPIGLISTALINHKLLFKLAVKLRISDKLDNIGVWNKAFEADNLSHWIIIRDIQNDLMYRGWVEAFSDGLDNHEILLRDVEVFRNSNRDLLYSIPGLYFLLRGDDLRIEFQSWEFTENYNNVSEKLEDCEQADDQS